MKKKSLVKKSSMKKKSLTNKKQAGGNIYKEISKILKKKLPNELVLKIQKYLEYKSIKSEKEYKGIKDTIVMFKDEFRKFPTSGFWKSIPIRMDVGITGITHINDEAWVVIKYKKQYYQIRNIRSPAPKHFGILLVDFIRSYGPIKKNVVKSLQFIDDLVKKFRREKKDDANVQGYRNLAKIDAGVKSDILKTAVEWVYRIDLNDNTLTIKGQPKDFLIQKTYPLDNIPTNWLEQITPMHEIM